jgi:hypothetical protein
MPIKTPERGKEGGREGERKGREGRRGVTEGMPIKTPETEVEN